MVTIREERPEHIETIRAMNQRAFGQPQESRLGDLLRKNRGVLLSLVAISDGRVVGHILYSPVTVGSDGEEVIGVALAPTAVLRVSVAQGDGDFNFGISPRKPGSCFYQIFGSGLRALARE